MERTRQARRAPCHRRIQTNPLWSLRRRLRRKRSQLPQSHMARLPRTAQSGPPYPPNQRMPKQQQKNIFKMPPSQLLGCSNVNRPVDAFSLLLSDKVVSDVVKYTNIEGQRVSGEAWVPMDKVECEALLGLLLFLGTRKQNMLSTESIWDSVYGCGIVRACMSRRRFQVLLQFLRFDDKSTRNARRRKIPLPLSGIRGMSL